MRGSSFVVLVLVLTGCGSPPPEQLLGGSASGSYDGSEFTAENGIAVQSGQSFMILLGDGNLYCGAEDSTDPPVGHNVAIRPPAFEVGSYGSVLVNMYQNVSSFEGVGTNTGSVTLSEVTDEFISGEVSFSYTDDEGRDFSFSGSFDVVRCP